jgi:hypothetical protein
MEFIVGKGLRTIRPPVDGKPARPSGRPEVYQAGLPNGCSHVDDMGAIEETMDQEV